MDKRRSKRKVERTVLSVNKHAKQDMMEYLSKLDAMPTDAEVLAWQHGYLAGINRANGEDKK